jgi:hypothetical protein
MEHYNIYHWNHVGIKVMLLRSDRMWWEEHMRCIVMWCTYINDSYHDIISNTLITIECNYIPDSIS